MKAQILGFWLIGGLFHCVAVARGTSSGSGIPNPASTACVKAGGSLLSFAEGSWHGSQWGICSFADNAMIGDWTLLGALQGEKSIAVTSFLAGAWEPAEGPIEGWAALRCEARGGKVMKMVDRLKPSVNFQTCHFEDGSQIEVWTLFAGPAGYPELAKKLGH